MRVTLAAAAALLLMACASPKATGPSTAFCMPCNNPCLSPDSCKPPAPPPPKVVAPVPVDPCAPGQVHTPAQCPYLDDDGDGILNKDDACPLEKGIPELKGCPAKDSDGDGIPDYLDKCPNEPGTAEYQGCPPPKKAAISATKVEITDKVYFDTGKATIQPRSYDLLNDVATVLAAHPEVKNVRIEGHTDSTGKAAFNRKLSLQRAEAVKAYLAGKGVDASRLSAEGFGPDRPVASNKTKAGREKNRRVEFMIGNGAAK